MLSYKTIPILLYLVVECFSHKIVTFYPTRLYRITRTSLLLLPRTQVLLGIGTTIRSADSTNLFQHACTSILQQPSTSINPASLPNFPRLLHYNVPESCYRNALYILQICTRKVSRQSYTNITPINSSDYVLLSYMFSQKLLSIFG